MGMGRKNKGYHLWNPFTVMNEFLRIRDLGPLTIVKGEGPYIYNQRGKRYINGLSSMLNVAIGHGRTELVEAAARQMQELSYASLFRQTHPRAVELAAKLAKIAPADLEHVFLCSNGSEAVETAIKMVRQYHSQSPDPKDRGRRKIISLRAGYHGVSYGAISTAGIEGYDEKFGPLVGGFLQIEAPFCYRCPNGEDYPGCDRTCAKSLERLILDQGPETVAAFMVEPFLAVGGFIVPPDEYFEEIGEICRKYGVVLIADEISTAFGRTGKLFACQDWAIKPDILCLGKGISSGYLPLAATLATHKIYERFEGQGNQFFHGSTAGGHPVCSAVGLANIEIILRENLCENASRVGAFLLSGLREIMDERDLIGNVRGKGLMIGVELVEDRETKKPLGQDAFFIHLLDIIAQGMMLYPLENSLGLAPPLTIDETLASEILNILSKALNSDAGARIARKARIAAEFAKEFTLSKLGSVT